MISIDAKVRVRYKETDQMGVVHHSNYYVWFEIGRTEYMRIQGLSYNEMENKGLMLPLTETHCKYIQGAMYDDEVIIRTRMVAFSGARLTMEYDVIREKDNCILAKGKTVHGVTNKDLKPVNIKKVDPEIFRLFNHCIHPN